MPKFQRCFFVCLFFKFFVCFFNKKSQHVFNKKVVFLFCLQERKLDFNTKVVMIFLKFEILWQKKSIFISFLFFQKTESRN